MYTYNIPIVEIIFISNLLYLIYMSYKLSRDKNNLESGRYMLNIGIIVDVITNLIAIALLLIINKFFG